MNDNLKQQLQTHFNVKNYDLGLFFEQLQTHFKNDKVNIKKKGLARKIVRLKKKLRHLITEYRVDHIHGSENLRYQQQTNKQTTAYELANTLYRKYQADKNKKDGLTLHEIETLNKFYE